MQVTVRELNTADEQLAVFSFRHWFQACVEDGQFHVIGCPANGNTRPVFRRGLSHYLAGHINRASVGP